MYLNLGSRNTVGNIQIYNLFTNNQQVKLTIYQQLNVNN